MDFLTLSCSRSFEKCPGPDPKSTIVLNWRFISYTDYKLADNGKMKVNLPQIFLIVAQPLHPGHNRLSHSGYHHRC